MKKALPAIVVVLIVGLLAWYFTSGPGSKTADPAAAKNTAAVQTAAANTTDTNTALNGEPADKNEPDPEAAADNEGLEDEEIKPATEIYKNADDALVAIKNAAKSYDDSVLEQFSDLGPSCSWCDGFYSSLSAQMHAPETSQDEKSYFAEVLAISGRVDNVKTLVESIRSASKPEDADVYAEALELATGKDDVTSHLGSQLNGANDNLRESLVAALTNQSSRLAAETLYKNTVERGDADGYYSQGIGLGEFIPNDESMPFLQELVGKHDQYSHLAAKALLNSGTDGVRIVLDSLENSNDPDFDRKMLKDAVDHVSHDEDVEALLKKRLESTTQPAAREFIQEALKSFESESDATEADQADLQAEGDAPPAE